MAQDVQVVTAKALASELDMTPKKLRRKLRALAATGEVEHTKADRWEFTPEEAERVAALVTATPEEDEES